MKRTCRVCWLLFTQKQKVNDLCFVHAVEVQYHFWLQRQYAQSIILHDVIWMTLRQHHRMLQKICAVIMFVETCSFYYNCIVRTIMALVRCLMLSPVMHAYILFSRVFGICQRKGSRNGQAVSGRRAGAGVTEVRFWNSHNSRRTNGQSKTAECYTQKQLQQQQPEIITIDSEWCRNCALKEGITLPSWFANSVRIFCTFAQFLAGFL